MKKQFKTAVLAIALVASTTMVFASDIASLFTQKDNDVYHWVRKTRAGVVIPGSQITGDATNPYPDQCPGLISTTCAEGTLDGDSSPSLFYYYD